MKKKILSLVLAVVMIAAFMPAAMAASTVDSGTCGDNLTWTLDSDGTLTISGTGEMWDFNRITTIVPWNEKKAVIKTVIVKDGVTSIGEKAFYKCENITAVNLCDSISKISDDAFGVCKKLQNIKIPNKVKSIGNDAFRECGLKKVNIPNGVECIGLYAFQLCSALESVTISQTVTSIGEGAFSDCEKLKSIEVSEKNTSYKDNDGVLIDKGGERVILCPPGNDRKSYKIPEGVICIERLSFSGCKNIESITLSNSIVTIEDGAFANCVSLKEINWSEKLSSIGFYAFQCCFSLQKIKIPESVTAIGAQAFVYCTGLKKVELPRKIEVISVEAFNDCTNLSSISIPGNVESIYIEAFKNCYNLTDVYYGGSEDEWNEISIESGNDYLTKAKIHYNSYYEADPEEKEGLDLTDGYCVENETGYLSGSLEINGGDIRSAVSAIKWESSDEAVAEVGEVGHINSVDGKSSVIDVEIIGHKIGKAKITATTADGQKAEATVSVEPKLNDESGYTISKATTIKYEISTDSDNRAYFKEFLSSLGYEVTGVFSPGITVKSYGYTIAGDGKSAVYEFEVEPKTNLTDNYIEITSEYGQTAKIPVRYEKERSGFSIQNDGWSFANSEWSFSGEVNSNGKPKKEYVMPIEIYEKVYGRSYIEANDITTGELFNGFCAGMSSTAILFYDGLLDWSDIDDSYDNDFGTVNSYYDAIAYCRDTKLDPKWYYVTSNPNTKVTKLIECYHLWGNHVRYKSQSSTFNDIERTYEKWEKSTVMATDETEGENSVYKHRSYEEGGTYVYDALNIIKDAVGKNTPLYISLQFQDGGHAIVARTDKAPEDEGNGWWKVFVYDPNKPYVSDSILDIIRDADSDYRLLQNSCNDLLASGEDCYMELNPKKNLWRYNCSLNSESTSSLIGCDEHGKVKYKGKSSTKEGKGTQHKTETYIMEPEYFVLCDPADFFEGTFDDPSRSWLPSQNENTITVPVNRATSFEIYSSDHELLAAAADGYGISLDNSIKFYPYTNAAEGSGATTGELVLPKDEYEFVIDSGTLRVWGHDNVINLTAEAGATAVINIEKNKVDVTAEDDGSVKILLSNVESADKCDTYKIEGDLEEGESVSAELPESGEIKTDTDADVDVTHNGKDVETEPEEPEEEQEKPTEEKKSKSKSVMYTVEFDTDGGSYVESQRVRKYGVVAIPDEPTKDGCIFDGWYADSDLTTEFDFKRQTVTQNMTIYAAWESEDDDWDDDYPDIEEYDEEYYKKLSAIINECSSLCCGDKYEYYVTDKVVYAVDFETMEYQEIIRDGNDKSLCECYGDKYLYYRDLYEEDDVLRAGDILIYDLDEERVIKQIDDDVWTIVCADEERGKVYYRDYDDNLFVINPDWSGKKRWVLSGLGDCSVEEDYGGIIYIEHIGETVRAAWYDFESRNITYLSDEYQDTFMFGGNILGFIGKDGSEETVYCVPPKKDGSIQVYVNYSEVEFDQKPIIRNDRTLVPMRAIFESLGCEVEWDDGEIAAYCDDGTKIHLEIGNKTMLVYDKYGSRREVTLDAAPIIEGDRTLVPVRAISEALGCEVFWNPYCKLVWIESEEWLEEWLD